MADHHGVSPVAITLGNGSNDVLDMVARVFLQPGTESVFSEHAFAVYPIATQAVGATARVAPARDYGHDLEAMAALVTEQHPGGVDRQSQQPHRHLARRPTGCAPSSRRCPRPAWWWSTRPTPNTSSEPDFPDATQWLEAYPNLIVTRTFSKAHGLAALRVGYALSDPRVADLLNRVRQPFNVNSLAQAAAAAALDDRGARAGLGGAESRRACGRCADGFERLGLGYIPSVGNFVTVDLGRPAAPINEALLRQGVHRPARRPTTACPTTCG